MQGQMGAGELVKQGPWVKPSTASRSNESDLFAVNHFGIEDALALLCDPSGFGIDLAIEATPEACMAGRTANLINLDQDGIRVAIEVEAMELLHVAALLSLAPKFVTAAAKVADMAGLESFFVGFCIHVGQHQYIARSRILGNHGDEGHLLEIWSFAHVYKLSFRGEMGSTGYWFLGANADDQTDLNGSV